jgi:threonine dehydrogenase-like Zn-dependent dehydrogenase
VKGNSVIECQDVEPPTTGPGQVVVQTRVSAICGSEMGNYRGDSNAAGNSGHEAAGTVVELGVGVTELQVGQRVGVSCVSGCGHCEYCAKGQYTWCSNFAFYGQMHAERFVVPAIACHALPDDVPWDVGVLISGDGLGVPYHTSTKLAGRDVDTIAIFGLGPIGLGGVLLQSFLGRRAIGIDVAPRRLELAKLLGAIHTIDASQIDDVVGAIRDLTNGEGPDVCIEAAGRPETVKQCFAAVRTAGLVIFNGEQPAVTLSPSQDFIRRDITAVGVWYYHFSEFSGMLDLYRSGLPVDKLVTHHFPLCQASEGYRVMAARESGKVLLDYAD